MIWKCLIPPVAAALAAIMAPYAALAQDSVAQFYRGKQINLYVGSTAGGGYDAYARLLARKFASYIPGNPTIIPQNMPGAGSFAAANFMADAAPKDGTVFGMLTQTLALDSRVNRSPKLDITKSITSAAPSPTSTPAQRCPGAGSNHSRTCA